MAAAMLSAAAMMEVAILGSAIHRPDGHAGQGASPPGQEVQSVDKCAAPRFIGIR